MAQNNRTTRSTEFRRRTDLDPAQESALTADDEFRAAIDAAGIGIFDYRPLSGELFWNTPIREQFGLSPDAAVNYNVFLVGLHPGDRVRVEQQLQGALAPGGVGPFTVEFRTIGIEDRKERLLSMTGKAFFNRLGEAVRFIAVTREERPAGGGCGESPR